jgi:hypothetical protein
MYFFTKSKSHIRKMHLVYFTVKNYIYYISTWVYTVLFFPFGGHIPSAPTCSIANPPSSGRSGACLPKQRGTKTPPGKGGACWLRLDHRRRGGYSRDNPSLSPGASVRLCSTPRYRSVVRRDLCPKDSCIWSTPAPPLWASFAWVRRRS